LARHEIIEVSCDRCGAVLDTAIVKPDRDFAVDGQQYRIDLCVIHTSEFDNVLAPFLVSARTTSGRRTRTAVRRRTSRSTAAGGSPKDIRTWARANGFSNVSDRGRVPREILAAWQAAQGSTPAANGANVRKGRTARKASPVRKRAASKRTSAAKKSAANGG
jgi:Lsr2